MNDICSLNTNYVMFWPLIWHAPFGYFPINADFLSCSLVLMDCPPCYSSEFVAWRPLQWQVLGQEGHHGFDGILVSNKLCSSVLTYKTEAEFNSECSVVLFVRVNKALRASKRAYRCYALIFLGLHISVSHLYMFIYIYINYLCHTKLTWRATFPSTRSVVWEE